jgi:hypothetical protein
MTDQQMLTEIQYALMEPPDGGASWPSEIWTRDEVLDGVNGALRELLRGTHLVVLRTELVVLAGALSIPLPTAWMATATAVWRDTTTNIRTPLGPVDSFEGDLALPSWETTTGLPLGFVMLDQANLTARLIPTPNANGVVELLYIAQPTAMTGANLTLPVPDEFSSGIKYNTLGWLLGKVGRLQDPERAKYCDTRYDLTEMAANLILGGWA